MNILVVTSDYPITTRMAGSPRLFNLCRFLAESHRLTLAFLPKTREREAPFRDDPDNRRVFAEVIPLRPVEEIAPGEPTWWLRQSHRFSREPFFSLRKLRPRYCADLREEIAAIIDRREIDLLYFDGLDMVQFAPARRTVPVAVDYCDCHSLLFQQQARLEKRLYRKVSLFRDARRVARAEQEFAELAGLSIFISEQDEQGLKAGSPHARTLVVRNGVDTEYFAPQSAAETGPGTGRLIFTGVMAYGPNTDAAIFFAREIFPLVKTQQPAAEFWIVGSNPPDSVTELAEVPDVYVTGTVADVRPYLQQSDIFVSPLRFGAGMKNKILTALSMQIPVVATPLSLSGLDTLDGEHLLAASTPSDFAENISALLKHPEKRERLVDNGRAFVETQYAWRTHGAQLESALTELVASGPCNGSPSAP